MSAPVDWMELSKKGDACIVCGCQAVRLLYPPTFNSSLAEAPAYFLAHRTATAHGPIVRCNDCGFVFTSPRFDAEDYDRIYGSIPTPHEGVAEFDAAKVARFRRLAAIVRSIVPRGAPFLDFGCGDGAFLREMNDPAGIGFEIGPSARRRVGQSKIIVGDWRAVAGSAELPRQSLDAVTAFDVLEHLPRIGDDLARIRSLLRSGGLLFASVPNIESIAARAMGRRWNMILLEHLWYFSPKTFDRFLSRNGFERHAMRTIPFDAPLAHLVTRLAQTFGLKGVLLPRGISSTVLPVPAGIMLGIYRAK